MLYFTIGEVSRLCQLEPHVLRYWEQEFPQISPSKRKGNRRYYQRKDVVMIRQIRHLLYEQGYTIPGARAKLAATSSEPNEPKVVYRPIKEIVADLEFLLAELEE